MSGNDFERGGDTPPPSAPVWNWPVVATVLLLVLMVLLFDGVLITWGMDPRVCVAITLGSVATVIACVSGGQAGGVLRRASAWLRRVVLAALDSQHLP